MSERVESSGRGRETAGAIHEEIERRHAALEDFLATRDVDFTLVGMGGGEVTPEMLLAIARRRITDLDEQVVTIMDDLNRRTAAATAISTELGELRTISHDLEASYDSNGNLNLDSELTHLANERSIPRTPGPTIRDYLAALEDQGVIDATERSAIEGGREGLDDLIDGANEELRKVNSGNEMLMIQLQSTMQSRTSVVQTVTNLLKSLDEGNDAIVGNLR